MKKILTSLLSFSLTFCFSQNIKTLESEWGYLVDKSPKGEIAFQKQEEQCKALLKEMENKDVDNLNAKEKERFEECLEDKAGYWSILDIGCSWYCGGGMDTLSASSELKGFKDINYNASNAHDLSYKTAWVEGVEGYGIGESITYHFPPTNPRITEIIIVNGYAKSEKAWKNNSRVKRLKMYLDEKPFAILNLDDVRNEQSFKFDPLGYSDREDTDKLRSLPWWTMRFEIMEVYEGDKYDDTAITEIYFDGIDVH